MRNSILGQGPHFQKVRTGGHALRIRVRRLVGRPGAMNVAALRVHTADLIDDFSPGERLPARFGLLYLSDGKNDKFGRPAEPGGFIEVEVAFARFRVPDRPVPPFLKTSLQIVQTGAREVVTLCACRAAQGTDAAKQAQPIAKDHKQILLDELSHPAKEKSRLSTAARERWPQSLGQDRFD